MAVAQDDHIQVHDWFWTPLRRNMNFMESAQNGPLPEEQQANAETRFMIQVGWKSRSWSFDHGGDLLVGGDWNHGISWLSIQLGMSSSLTFTPSLFRGVGWNHQPDYIITLYSTYKKPWKTTIFYQHFSMACYQQFFPQHKWTIQWPHIVTSLE